MKKRTKKNIIFFITVATPVIGILMFFYNYKIENIKDKYEIEKAELKTKISSIERNIGDNKYFDVRQFFTTDNTKDPIYSSEYISQGNFYADTTDTNWIYKKISPLSYVRNELNINPLELQIGRKNSLTLDSILSNKKFKDYRKSYKFHQWKYKDSIEISNSNEKEILNSSINVFVIKKDIAKLIFNVINENVKKDKALLKSYEIDSVIVNQVIGTAKKQYEKNSSGLIFSVIINGIVYNSLLSGELIELQNIQKKSEVFYTKYNKEYLLENDKAFETGEIFFAEKNDNIYIVLIKIFDKEPLIQMEKAADINKWLFSLKFI
ncbi:hypothetical protein SAMN05444411_1332 [Lutibacter oricola]|uniref:Uncharacterized protein n=1 Tax=Lutibacter oricola TaxID=762486 RepID=A0A1H3HE22_9FLAO|nr:hypothetical protein [Lutibacter oricola]SDY13014.1 hypothetical protein SAMN05444411_1332 [Lutibacter oricola]